MVQCCNTLLAYDMRSADADDRRPMAVSGVLQTPLFAQAWLLHKVR